MAITTIQLNDNIKRELDKIKSSKETYEEVIIDLMKVAQQYKRKQKEHIIEGYRETAKVDLAIDEEWSSADKGWD